MAARKGTSLLITGPKNLTQTIPGSQSEPIEALCWTLTNSTLRLFSAGLSGSIVEHDLTTLLPKAVTHSMGGGVWSMAASPQLDRIAVGCEDGLTRVFGFGDEGELVFERGLERQKVLDEERSELESRERNR
jgi:WD40 repeat protein